MIVLNDQIKGFGAMGSKSSFMYSLRTMEKWK